MVSQVCVCVCVCIYIYIYMYIYIYKINKINIHQIAHFIFVQLTVCQLYFQKDVKKKEKEKGVEATQVPSSCQFLKHISPRILEPFIEQ